MKRFYLADVGPTHLWAAARFRLFNDSSLLFPGLFGGHLYCCYPQASACKSDKVPWRKNSTTFCQTTPSSLNLFCSVKTQGLLSNWKSPWQGKSVFAHPRIPSVHERHYHEMTPVPHMEATWPQKCLPLTLSSAIFRHEFPQWAALWVGFAIQNSIPWGGPFACKVAAACIL